MKKLILLITLITLFSTESRSQNFREWFRQNKTQRQYLIKQITLLKVQIRQVKKGVEIVRRGLNTIKNVADGEFNLHKDFFSHLKNVNPIIANSAKAADIIAFQLYIMQNIKRTRDYCRSNENFTVEEAKYVADIYANMLILTAASIEELLTIVRPDKLELSDDERLARIDKLHIETLNQHEFVQSFDADMHLIAHERQREVMHTEYMRNQLDL